MILGLAGHMAACSNVERAANLPTGATQAVTLAGGTQQTSSLSHEDFTGTWRRQDRTNAVWVIQASDTRVQVERPNETIVFTIGAPVTVTPRRGARRTGVANWSGNTLVINWNDSRGRSATETWELSERNALRLTLRGDVSPIGSGISGQERITIFARQ